MSTFPLEIISLNRVVYDGPCESLVIPAPDGEYGIMAGHEPVMVAISAGEMRYTLDKQTTVLAVGDGFIEVTDRKVNVLVDFAERADEIDMIRAQAAAERAKEQIQAHKDAMTVAHAEQALARAIARIRVGGKNAIH